ncbi:MAG: ABC transporter permease [Candidatus Aminicenantes bacterium]|nr:ABC transporter permease [Candidatus Aminicenantes bacterium]
MKAWIIIKKEYKQIVMKKSFVIATILTPALMAGFIFLPLLLSRVSREEKIIEIADFSGIIQEQFIKRSEETKEVRDTLKLKFINIEVKDKKQLELIRKSEKKITGGEDVDFPLLPEYRKKILEKKSDGLLIIPDDVGETRRIFFCALNISDFGANEYIRSAVQRILSEKILTEQKIELKIVAEAIRDISLGTYKVKKEGTKKLSSQMEYMMSIFMLAILFSMLMAYGQLTMRGVLEEKNNRIVEVLISSTDTQNFFYGKIIGIGLAGLTQVALWGILGAIFLGSTSSGVSKDLVGTITPELGVYFLVFFIIGYFMYAVLFSIVGAAVNTDQEAQQFAAPITYLLVIPFIIGIIVTQSPNTPLVTAASLFPLFTPTLMFMRICVALPAFSQVLISIVTSILFTMFLAWLGARIFRVGILMYGKKPSIKEIMKWLKYK